MVNGYRYWLAVRIEKGDAFHVIFHARKYDDKR